MVFLSLKELTDREAVLKAIAEFDALGQSAFLAKYRFGASRAFFLVYDGKRYDSKAIVGAAYSAQYPDRPPLTAKAFSGGDGVVRPLLEGLGFSVEVDVSPGQVAKWFRDLRVASSNGQPFPHKPLLALMALARLERGDTALVPVEELAADLRVRLETALPRAHEPSPWEPIWRLERRIWQLQDEGGDPRELHPQDDPPISRLRSTATRGGLTAEVVSTLTGQDEWIHRIKQDLVDRFLNHYDSACYEDLVHTPQPGGTGAAPTRHWLFQANPERWDLAAALDTWEVDHLEPWTVSRYAGQMQAGDDVVLFASGPDGGILALASIAAAPTKRPRPEKLADGPEELQVADLRLERRLQPPVTRQQLKQHPVLQELMVLRFANATNYRMSIEEWSALMEMLDDGTSEHQRCIAVYVGKTSEPNFEFSESDGRWGWKADQVSYELIRRGDLIVFGFSYGGGSPRVQLDEYLRHDLGRLVVGRVTEPIQEFTDPYWPDESVGLTYPYRLTFEVLEDDRDVAISSLDARLGGPVADAIRYSGTQGGRGVVVDLARTVGPVPSFELSSICDRFADDLRASGYDYGVDRHEELTRAFVVSLATKRFVILTGLSGSGKTKIAQRFGQWLGAGRLEIIAVRPDWTSPEPLLGYENGLSEAKETGLAWNVPHALSFILRAVQHPTEPHLLLLDEMNLAHVERYFADVLSGIESRAGVVPNLSRQDGEWRLTPGQPDRLPLPNNLFIVGTVNIDETTYMFSPKVLDRANTIEFRVATSDLQVGASADSEIASTSAGLGRSFLELASRPAPPADGGAQVADWLRELHGRLSAHGREFGHRTFAEALRFTSLFEAAGGGDALTALDLQVLQKVLPKYHGSVRDLTEPLNDLGAWAFFGPGSAPDSSFDAAAEQLGDPVLPRSWDKVHRMAKRLRANHFVSFAE